LPDLEDRISEMGTRSRVRPVRLPAERPFPPHHGRPPPALEAGRSAARPLARRPHRV